MAYVSGDPWTLLSALNRQRAGAIERERQIFPAMTQYAAQQAVQNLEERKQSAAEQARLAESLGQPAPEFDEGPVAEAARMGAGRAMEARRQAESRAAAAEALERMRQEGTLAKEQLGGAYDIEERGMQEAGAMARLRERLAHEKAMGPKGGPEPPEKKVAREMMKKFMDLASSAIRSWEPGQADAAVKAAARMMIMEGLPPQAVQETVEEWLAGNPYGGAGTQPGPSGGTARIVPTRQPGIYKLMTPQGDIEFLDENNPEDLDKIEAYRTQGLIE